MKTNAKLLILGAVLLGLPLYEASAYYDPDVQRWINRDPVQEYGGINLYSPSKNNLISKLDPLGLCTKTCDEICAEFNKLSDAGATGSGTTVCNGSAKCACYTPGPNDPAAGECPDLEKIILDHEKSHFEEVNCPGSNHKNQFPDFPTWKKGFDPDFAECRARVDSLGDLKNALSSSSGKCRDAMQQQYDELYAWVLSNCD